MWQGRDFYSRVETAARQLCEKGSKSDNNVQSTDKNDHIVCSSTPSRVLRFHEKLNYVLRKLWMFEDAKKLNVSM